MLELLWPVFWGVPCRSQHGCGPWHDLTFRTERASCCFCLFVDVVCAFINGRDQRVIGTFWVIAQLQSTGRVLVNSMGGFLFSASCSDCLVTLMLTVNVHVSTQSYQADYDFFQLLLFTPLYYINWTSFLTRLHHVSPTISALNSNWLTAVK